MPLVGWAGQRQWKFEATDLLSWQKMQHQELRVLHPLLCATRWLCVRERWSEQQQRKRTWSNRDPELADDTCTCTLLTNAVHVHVSAGCFCVLVVVLCRCVWYPLISVSSTEHYILYTDILVSHVHEREHSRGEGSRPLNLLYLYIHVHVHNYTAIQASFWGSYTRTICESLTALSRTHSSALLKWNTVQWLFPFLPFLSK